MKEVWKDIPEYENSYQVSNLGRVYSKITNKMLKQSKTTTGYKKVELYRNKQKKSVRVHRLVMYAFFEVKKDIINHKDGNPLNNNLNNLEYCNQSHNMKHAYKLGLAKSNYFGLEDEIAKHYKNGIGIKEISKKFNVGYTSVKRILKDKNIEIRNISEAQNKYYIDLDYLKELILDGYTNKEISKIFNCPRSLIATRKCQIKKGELIWLTDL